MKKPDEPSEKRLPVLVRPSIHRALKIKAAERGMKLGEMAEKKLMELLQDQQPQPENTAV